MADAADIRWMRLAISLGRRGLGTTWPNPSVGCVIARDGLVLGRGWTAPGGRPHAETSALEQAGEAARGATGYVSLEPCAHHGQTPPCAEALAAAGLARVVIGCTDPDPRVSGQGIAILKASGVDVTTDVCVAEAEDAHSGFLTRMREGRPWITLSWPCRSTVASRWPLAKAAGSPGRMHGGMRTPCAPAMTRC